MLTYWAPALAVSRRGVPSGVRSSLGSRLFWLALLAQALAHPAHALVGFTLEDTILHPTNTDWPGGTQNAVSGDTIMVHNQPGGLVYVFERDASGNWPLIQTISNSTNTVNFGALVSISGDTAVIYSPVAGSTASDRHFVYIRVPTNPPATRWQLATELIGPAGVMRGFFDGGKIFANRIVMEAQQTTKANPVVSLLVYDRPAGGWNAAATMNPTTTIDLGNSANNTIRLQGVRDDTIALRVQAPLSNVPWLEIWVLSGATWGRAATLTSSNPTLTVSGGGYLDTDAAILGVSGQINAYNKDPIGWFDKVEDARISDVNASSPPVAFGIDGTTILAAPLTFDALYVFDAPAGQWSNMDTASQEITINGTIQTPRPALDGGTIVAAPFVYRTADPRVDLAIEKVAGSDPVTAREDFTYTITVTNQLVRDATQVTVTDTLGPELAYVSHTTSAGTCARSGGTLDVDNRFVGETLTCDLGTLAGSGQETITITVDAPAETRLVGNLATVTSFESDINGGDNSSSTATMVELPSVVDSQNLPEDGLVDFGAVTLNAQATASVTVTAHGHAPTTIVSVDPTNPPFTISTPACFGQALSPGQICTFDVTFEPTVIGDHAATPSINFGEYSLPLMLTGTGSQVLISDSRGDPTDRLVDFGGVFVDQFGQETVTIDNQSPDDLVIGQIAANTGQPTDQLEPPFSILNDTCSNTVLAAGTACTFDVRVEPTMQFPTTSDEFSIPVGAALEAFTLRATGVFQTVELSISKAGPDSVDIGAGDTYWIRVDAALGSASGVVVEDILPDGLTFIASRGLFGEAVDYDPATGIWNVGDMSSGGRADLFIDFAVDGTVFTSLNCVTNTARIVALNEQDVTTDDNEATVYTAIAWPSCADLAVTSITDDPDPVPPQLWAPGTTTYTVTVANLSPPQVAGGTSVAFKELGGGIVYPSGDLVGPDCLPSGVEIICTIGDFTGTRTYSFNAQGPRGGATLHTQATIQSSFTLDPDPTNDVATEDTVTNAEVVPIPVVSNPGQCPIGIVTTDTGLEKHVDSIRRFRDRFLKRTALGRAFVAWYYEVGPSVVAVLVAHPILRAAAFVALTPVVYAFAFPLTTLLALGLAIGAVTLLRRLRRFGRYIESSVWVPTLDSI